MAIVQAQPDYFVVTIDKSNPKIVIHHHEIIAWDIYMDEYNLPQVGKEPTAITIFGVASGEFISHPTGTYTEIATGVQYNSLEEFKRVMQNLHDDELSKLES